MFGWRIKIPSGFVSGRQLQPSDADPLHRRHRLRQGQPEQGGAEGPDEEEEGPFPGPNQVRGAIQVRQEQVVLPEAAVLNFACRRHLVTNITIQKEKSASFIS